MSEDLTLEERQVLSWAIKNPKKFQVMQVLVENEILSPAETKGSPDYAQQLLAAHRAYGARESFRIGDLVKWKDRLKNKRVPGYDEPVVVVNVLEQPLLDEAEKSDSAYFREPLDMQIGFLDDDREFVMYFVDSQRFTKFDSPSTAPSVEDEM
jgi:hypothetical protein